MRRNHFLRTSVALAAVTAVLGACSESSADPDDKAEEGPPSSSPAASEESSPPTPTPTEEIVLPEGVLALPESDAGTDFRNPRCRTVPGPAQRTLSLDVDLPSESYAHDDGLLIATKPSRTHPDRRRQGHLPRGR